jgi:hypothetical protein
MAVDVQDAVRLQVREVLAVGLDGLLVHGLAPSSGSSGIRQRAPSAAPARSQKYRRWMSRVCAENSRQMASPTKKKGAITTG